jgi:glutamate formiminotransferase/formiminotetrahydrofolate cyclodeaminase
MVAKLTYGVRKFEDRDAQMRAVIPPLHELTQALIPMVDADTDAFEEYMEGLRMPRDSEAERRARQEKMQKGLKTAIRVPLRTMQLGDRAWDALCETARYGNPASKSDTQVGARSLETGIWGAYQNVLINMVEIKDETFKTEILAEAEAIMGRAREKCAEVLAILAGE